MVMSKKEYEQMEYYKNCATKFEQENKKILNKIEDLKSYLKVTVDMVEDDEIDGRIIAFEEILKYMNKIF